jgi:hypothetical protein
LPKFVTPLDAATPIETDRYMFDSDETQILSTAFEKAWSFVEFDPMLGSVLDTSE